MNSVLIPKQQESQLCKHQVLLKENFLSEFLTKSEKQKVIQNLGLSTTIEWGKIKGYIEQQKDLIEVLSKFISKETEQAAQQILYSNDEYPNIKTLKDALDVLLYKDLTISVNITPNIAELGDTVENALLTWTYNKANIKQQTVDNMNIDKDIRQLALDRPVTSTITKKISGNDGTKIVSDSATLNFYPGIYYGTGLTQPLISSMQRLLLPSRACNITTSVKENECIWILLPTNYGVPTFIIDGITCNFQNIGTTCYKITNYTIWRSDNYSANNVTISII